MFCRLLKSLPFMTPLLTLMACSSPMPKPPATLQPGDYSYVKDYMSWFIEKQMREQGIVGLSVALVDDQRIVWQQGFGYADKANKIPATPQTRYRAGSISKLFNAMAVMKLVEAGKMNLDVPLRTYLPDFKIKSRFGDTDGITPRTILSHHSGLPGDRVDRMWTAKPVPFTNRVIELQDEYVAYPPNTLMSYSNLGITLLGHAVQDMAGEEYSQHIDKVLLNPMGMSDSRFERALRGEQSAKAYINGKEVLETPLNDLPAGALNTTVEDLARLGMMVNNQGKLNGIQVLKKDTLDLMMQPQNENIPLDLGQKMGLGWFIMDGPLAGQEPVYNHDGGTIAHRTSFIVAPKSKLAVVVFSNSYSADSQKIAVELLQKAWEAKFASVLPKISTEEPEGGDEFEGTWATLAGKAVIKKVSDKHYRVDFGKGKMDLKPDENGHYRLQYKLLGLIPLPMGEMEETRLYTRHIDGEHIIVAKEEFMKLIAGVKVKRQPVHEQWHQRLGRYTVLNPPEPEIFRLKAFELLLENGDLIVSMTPEHKINSVIGEKLIMRTINENEAIVEGLGRGMRETLHVIRDERGEELLHFSGLRLKKQ